MKIMAIETSCDDTCAAVVENEKVLSSVVSSQTDLHAEWGGVVPNIAKRAHQERIRAVIAKALRKVISYELPVTSDNNQEEKMERIIEEGMKEIDVIAVTRGPGLAIALGVGVNAAKELALKYNKKLVAVNHIEGHILANWAKNSKGWPVRDIRLPALALTVSGGHTKLVLVKNIGNYEVVGETLDDAAGEALDKASKLLGLGYPGGPIIERLAEKGDDNFLKLPRPLSDRKDFDYSFSGLKTSFYYQIKDWPKEKINKHIYDLAASFQRAVFDTLIMKFKKAVINYQPESILAAGGVMANLTLRKRLRIMAREANRPIYMPVKKQLDTDNAAMIGVAGYFKAKRGEFVENIEELDRDPRAVL